MSRPTEPDASPSDRADGQSAFVHTIRVGWADCDPARIVYTGKIPEFALEAIDAWWGETVGYDWFRLNLDCNYGTPFVHLELDFRSPVTPRWPLECSVVPIRLGERSISFRVVGRQDGRTCFEGIFVSAFVVADEFKPIRIPDEFRSRIEPLIQQA